MTIKKQSRLSFIIGFLIAILLTAGLTACSTPNKSSTIQIKRLIFLNQSSNALQDVKIVIGKTNELMHCGYILPRSECSTGFPLREYQGNRFDVSWTDQDQFKSVRDILALVPENLIPGKPVNAVIVFGDRGQFSARLQH